MITHYRLNGHEVEPCSFEDWTLLDISLRRVGLDEIEGYEVSTIFEGLNHALSGRPPRIFETAVLDAASGTLINVLERYATWDEAEQGHKGWCDAIRVRLKEQRLLGSDNGD